MSTFSRAQRLACRQLQPTRWWLLQCALVVALLGSTLLPLEASAQVGSLPATASVQPLPTTQERHVPVDELPTAQSAATQPSGGGYTSSGAPIGVSPEASGTPRRVPATIDSDYKIGINDLLEVEVFEVSELKRTVRVNDGGQISLPLIGLVRVAGLSPSDAERLIATRYGEKYLQDPQVSIFIREFTSQRITVDGAVSRPGIYPLTGQMTLLRALAMAGGGASLSDLENVMLFRTSPNGQSLTEQYDVEKIRKGEAPDPVLRGDDVVVVNRDSARATLRDSLFSDILGTLNPFASTYRSAVGDPR